MIKPFSKTLTTNFFTEPICLTRFTFQLTVVWVVGKHFCSNTLSYYSRICSWTGLIPYSWTFSSIPLLCSLRWLCIYQGHLLRGFLQLCGLSPAHITLDGFTNFVRLGQPGSRGNGPLGVAGGLSHFLFIHFKWGGVFTLMKVFDHTLLSKERCEIPLCCPCWSPAWVPWVLIFPHSHCSAGLQHTGNVGLPLGAEGKEDRGARKPGYSLGTTEHAKYTFPLLNPTQEQRMDYRQDPGTKSVMIICWKICQSLFNFFVPAVMNLKYVNLCCRPQIPNILSHH